MQRRIRLILLGFVLIPILGAAFGVYKGLDRGGHATIYEQSIAVLAALSAIGVAVATSLQTYRHREAKRQAEVMIRAADEAYRSAVKAKLKASVELQKDREDLKLLATTSPRSEDAIADLRLQLDKITQRMEKQRNEIVEVQKIDPALEATLKVSVEYLAKRIDTLESKQLDKWNVALVCAQVIGGVVFVISTVSGVVLLVVKYLLHK